MQAYRPALAHTWKAAIHTYAPELEAAGWDPKLVREHMGKNAAASIVADGGDSGDTVRIVTAAAEVVEGNARAT